ncbi:hypothetical protein EDD85DRAFT_785247 [Armillaria nabsnona]|nr:hypothetical protein EDD85DRAFT_785247 [Armillaria nabsnona]
MSLLAGIDEKIWRYQIIKVVSSAYFSIRFSILANAAMFTRFIQAKCLQVFDFCHHSTIYLLPWSKSRHRWEVADGPLEQILRDGSHSESGLAATMEGSLWLIMEINVFARRSTDMSNSTKLPWGFSDGFLGVLNSDDRLILGGLLASRKLWCGKHWQMDAVFHGISELGGTHHFMEQMLFLRVKDCVANGLYLWQSDMGTNADFTVLYGMKYPQELANISLMPVKGSASSADSSEGGTVMIDAAEETLCTQARNATASKTRITPHPTLHTQTLKFLGGYYAIEAD